MAHGFGKGHECWVCGKLLSSYGKMRLHICLHTGERPHLCPVCGKGCISLEGFRRHVRSHENTSELDEKGHVHHDEAVHTIDVVSHQNQD